MDESENYESIKLNLARVSCEGKFNHKVNCRKTPCNIDYVALIIPQISYLVETPPRLTMEVKDYFIFSILSFYPFPPLFFCLLLSLFLKPPSLFLTTFFVHLSPFPSLFPSIFSSFFSLPLSLPFAIDAKLHQ